MNLIYFLRGGMIELFDFYNSRTMGFREWGRAAAIAAALSVNEGHQSSANVEKPGATVTVNAKGEKITKECGPEDACITHVEKRTDRDGLILYMNELIARIKNEKAVSGGNPDDWKFFKGEFIEEFKMIRELNPQLFDTDSDLKDLASQPDILLNS